MKKTLPSLEKAIDYMTSNPKRWDPEHGLVKRSFTIDTWDFTYEEDLWNRRIYDKTPMSIMHGDNSGVYQAMMQLAWLNDRFGNTAKAASWRKRAEALRVNMFKHLWNGTYFIHQLHLGHKGSDEKESVRLSLSNTYDINRGVCTLEQAQSVIDEYQTRRKTTDAFAEWFSIDPPYTNFCNWGEYINGAISPFTAGELAKAAFNNGREKYAWDILTRFQQVVKREGEVYFLYNRKDGKANMTGGGPSAWGAAAVLSAIDEGLAGMKDLGCKYEEIFFAPRWPVTDYTELRYVTGYEVSHVWVDVRYVLKQNGLRYVVYSPAKKINAHILLPDNKTCTRLRVNRQDAKFTPVKVGESSYVDFETAPVNGKTDIEVLF